MVYQSCSVTTERFDIKLLVNKQLVVPCKEIFTGPFLLDHDSNPSSSASIPTKKNAKSCKPVLNTGFFLFHRFRRNEYQSAE